MKTRFFFLISLLIVLMPLSLCAQKLMFSQPHGLCDTPFSIEAALAGSNTAYIHLKKYNYTRCKIRAVIN